MADAARGLLRIGEDRAVSVVSKEANGTPILYCDDVDVGVSGRVYFTDASDVAPRPMSNHPELLDTLGASITDCIRAERTGRLLRYDPVTERTEELFSGVWFANGVAVEPLQESYVLVCETFAVRVLKHHLTGPKKGTTEVFAQDFPGYVEWWVGLMYFSNSFSHSHTVPYTN